MGAARPLAERDAAGSGPPLVAEVGSRAAGKETDPGQVALGWEVALSAEVVPEPGVADLVHPGLGPLPGVLALPEPLPDSECRPPTRPGGSRLIRARTKSELGEREGQRERERKTTIRRKRVERERERREKEKKVVGGSGERVRKRERDNDDSER
jgi:hypothetical protein